MLKKNDLSKEIELRVCFHKKIQDMGNIPYVVGKIENKKLGAIFFHLFNSSDGEIFVSIFTSFFNYSRLKSVGLLKNFRGLIFHKVYKSDLYLEKDRIFAERLDFTKIERVETVKELFGIQTRIFFSKEDAERIKRLLFDNLIESDIHYDDVYINMSLEYKE